MSTLRDLVRLAAPIIVTELGTVANGFVAVLIAGRLGAEEIGAVGLGNILFGAVSVFGQGLVLGLDPLVAQAYGARRLEDCRFWLTQAVLLVLAAAVPLVLVLGGMAHVLSVWGIEPSTAGLTQVFLGVRAWSVVPALLFAAFRRYLQAMNHARPIALIMVLSNLLNLVCAIALVRGVGPLPGLGAVGIAWAALVSSVSAAAGLGWVVRLVASDQLAQRPQPDWRFDIGALRQLLGLGLPASLQLTLEVGVFATATALASRLDVDSLAAHQIVLQTTTLAWVVTVGIGTAGAVLVGQGIGSGDRQLARRRGWVALGTGVAFMVCAAGTMVLLPGPILGLFTDDPGVVAIGRQLLLVAAAFQIFDGLQAVATGVLRGAGDTRTPAITNLAAHWLLGLPLGYVLCFNLGQGVIGLWIGLSVGLIIVAAVLVPTWSYRAQRLGQPVGRARR